jgi:hypothetical protein
MGDKICVSVSSEVKNGFDPNKDFDKYKNSYSGFMTASVEKVITNSSKFKLGTAPKGQPSIDLTVTLDTLSKDDKPPPPKITAIIKVKAINLFPTAKMNTVTLKGKTEATAKLDKDAEYLLKEWLATDSKNKAAILDGLEKVLP